MSELTLSELKVLARKTAQSMHCRTVTPHPASARISAATLEWAKRFELVSDDLALKKLADIGGGLFAAYTSPRASEELLSISADLLAWYFAFDDEYGESSADTLRTMQARFATYRNALRTGQLPAQATALHRAILNICDRARVLANDPDCWSERFSNSLGTYFDGCLLEQPYRTLIKPPHLDEYRRIRALSIGFSPYLELIRIASANLSENDFEHPTLSRLQRSATLLVAFANDIYSFAKEKKDGAPLNLVSVLSYEFKLSIPEALDAAVETYNADLAIFERNGNVQRLGKSHPALC
jgi:hypothetical protein